MKEYALIDSGEQKKLEQFGPFTIVRPSPQAIWPCQCSKSEWKRADAIFSREKENRWQKKALPTTWEIKHAELNFQLSATDFGHLGLFPEQTDQWSWIRNKVGGKKVNVLNLFAYSGGATLTLAKEGCKVCHLDASKGMVEWAKVNAKLNHLERAPIRWIVDDALKFLEREVRRKSCYDGIILDPPSFGRGSKGQVFKIERDIQRLLMLSSQLLSPQPVFFLLTSHTLSFTPTVLRHLFDPLFTGRKGKIETGEMLIFSHFSFSLPSGTYIRWSPDG